MLAVRVFWSISAGDQIFVGAEEAVRVGEIWSTDDDVRLKAQGSIVNALGASGINFKADNLLLEAGDGGVGDSGDANVIYIDQLSTGFLTARGAGDIYLVEKTGDINVSTIYSSGGGVYLVAWSIVDALGTDFVNIHGSTIFG